MKTGISLVELARKIEGDRTAKKDFIVSSSDLSMVPMDQAVAGTISKGVAVQFGTAPARTHTLAINPVPHSQLATRLGIPSRYYDTMREKAPDLLCANVNHWFAQDNSRRMLRTKHGNLRAFLSDRYQRIENEEIAEVVLPILHDIPECMIVSCEVTEKRLYIQAVSPRVTADVKVGDQVQAGVIISNSEIGLGSASISALIYRLRCLNGMVLPDGKFAARHVGARVTAEEMDIYADDTKQADDRAVLLKIRDSVRAAVNEVTFKASVARLTSLTTLRITGDPAKAVEVLAQKTSITDTERGGVLRSLIEGGDISAYGLLNAVTHQAHTAVDYDRSVEFERIGGHLLALPPSQWREVLEAA